MSRWNTVKVAAWICVSGAVAPFYWKKKKMSRILYHKVNFGSQHPC